MTATTLSSVENRLLSLEIDRAVWQKTQDIELRVRDLEFMIKTARYVISVCAGLLVLVGIGVTAYVSSLKTQLAAASSAVFRRLVKIVEF